MIRAQIKRQLKAIVADQIGLSVDDVDVDVHKSFIDHGVDSLDSLEILMLAEDEFRIEISDEEAERILTVAQAVNLIQELLYHKLPKKEQNMSLATINLSTFKYRKDTGDTSSRTVVVVDDSDERVLGLEVIAGDLTPIQPYLAYEAELAEIREHLRAKHGIDQKKLPYKSFKNVGISARTDTSLQINL